MVNKKIYFIQKHKTTPLEFLNYISKRNAEEIETQTTPQNEPITKSDKNIISQENKLTKDITNIPSKESLDEKSENNKSKRFTYESNDFKVPDITLHDNKKNKIDIPFNLYAKLYPYQIDGYHWLLKHIQNKEGCIIADDMGLGKTIQIISVLLYLTNIHYINKDRKVLVIVPYGLILTWKKEFNMFAPSIKVHIYHDKIPNIGQRELNIECDVIITSYSLIKKDFHKFNCSWLFIIVDEAQKIKNLSTKTNVIINSINATHKIALSGTPLENNLIDFYAIFNFVNPGYLGNLTDFKQYFNKPIINKDNVVLENFLKIVKPYVLRRLKEEKHIGLTLPKKTIKTYYCQLTEEQRKLYNDILRYKKSQHKQAHKNLSFRHISITKMICNHPAQYNHSITNISMKQSGKMLLLKELLTGKLLNEKCVIYTQFVKGRLLADLIEKELKIKTLFLFGDCSLKEREQILDDFKNPLLQIPILIISLTAGGVGITLTVAKHLIIFDLWWNHALESQAMDRIYRIGQKQDVTIHRFITRYTIEEFMNKKIEAKQELANLILQKNINSTTLTKIEREQLLKKNKKYKQKHSNIATIKNTTHNKMNNMHISNTQTLNALNMLYLGTWYINESHYTNLLFMNNDSYDIILRDWKDKNSRYLHNTIKILPPEREYFCIQTTLSEDLFSLRDFISYKKRFDENTYNLKKINITQIHDLNLVKDLILTAYKNLKIHSKRNTTIIHFETILNTHNIYQKENQNQLKENIHAIFKKEIKPQNKSLIKNNINYIHLEIIYSKRKHILYENICSFITNFVKENKNTLFHHTILQKYVFFDYERNYDKNIYFKHYYSNEVYHKLFTKDL